MFVVVLTSACLMGQAAPEPETMTVATVIKSLSISEATMTYIDEPPGKLRAVEWDTNLHGTNIKVRVRIDIVYNLTLFSTAAKWDINAIHRARVWKVTITPAPGKNEKD